MADCGCDCDGITLATGAAGSDGDAGVHGGYSSTWLYDTSTSSGPSSGDFRFDSATVVVDGDVEGFVIRSFVFNDNCDVYKLAYSHRG